MEKYRISLKYQIISLILCIVMTVTVIPTTVFATGTNTASEIMSEENAENVEETTDETAIAENTEDPSEEELEELSERLSEENAILEESTENSTVFDLGDGKRAVVFYSQDMRYEEDGELVDYDPALVTIEEEESATGEKLSNYKYENKKGDSKNYIPEKLNKNSKILMEKDDYTIKMLPLDDNIQDEKVSLETEKTVTAYEEVKEKKTKAVYKTKDNKYSYEYTSLSQGVKENIILNEKPETNIFKFSLEVEGMYAELNEASNTILLKDEKTDKVIASVERPFMNDASGEAYSENLIYSMAEDTEGNYIVTLTISRKYLNSSERVYPVIIDPTATWKGTESFLDVYVINGSYADMNFYDEDTRVMPVGVASKGTYRTYFKVPNVKSTLSDKYIDSAYLTVYETGSCDAGQTVRMNRITESWSVSTLTWNNKPTYYSSSSVNSWTTEGTQYASHSIKMTNTVRSFVNSTNNPNYGFVLRNVTEDPGYACFYGSRCTSASYRPKMVVVYYDKPTALTSLSISRMSGESYVKSSYIPKGSSIYVSWKGIVSQNLSAVQYRFMGVDGTEQPTSIGSDAVDLSSYRSIGVATENGTNVRASYGASLPAGKYRLYVRGKDAGGMYGDGRYKTVYVDGDAPTLTNVSITPSTTVTTASGNLTPTISWTASDTYFSKVTVAVDDEEAITVTTASGEGTYAIPEGTITTSGAHTITIKSIDKAGKQTTKTLTYYADADVPEVSEISTTPATTESLLSGNRKPQLSWTITDADKAEEIEVLVNGESKYTTADSSVTSYQFTESDFAESGKYDVIVRVTDDNGNVSEKEISYYLDITAPVFEELYTTPETTELAPSGNKSPIISWNINDTALESVSYSLTGFSYTDMGSSKTGNYTLPSPIWASWSKKYTIYVKAKDIAGNECEPVAISYYLGEEGDYIPKDFASTEYYGKRFLTWRFDGFDDTKKEYDLHRSTQSTFTPGTSTLLEADIDAAKGLYVDKEILESGTYYYKIVVRDIADETVEDAYSEELSVTNSITTDQFVNTIGQKDYLSYLDVGLPMGNLSVEESSGNLIYSQSDFAVSNAQLSYGLDRTYNSKNQRTSMLGLGWTDSYHKEIYTDGTDIYYVDSDGSSYRFILSDSVYTCAETKEYELTVTETGYQIETKDDHVFLFNKAGQIISNTEPNGCQISYSYDIKGRLAYVISKEDKDSERKLILKYSGNSYQVASIEDFAGTVYEYTYSSGKLTKAAIGEKGKVSSGVSYDYSYGTNGLLSSVYDGMDNRYSVTYSNGKVSKVSYPDGEYFNFTYGSGTTTIKKYTSTWQNLHTEVVTYDTATGKLLTFQDAKGNVTTYEYVSEKPYLVAKIKSVKSYQTLDSSNNVTFHETENITETEYVYDANENLIEETSSDGSVTEYTYDENEDLIAEETVKSNETIEDITYAYDEYGNIEITEDLIDNTVENNEYGDDGNLVSSVTTDEGNVISESESQYDGQGNVTGSSSETGNVTSEVVTEYDAMGRPVKTVENGITTTTEYDFLGRDIKTTTRETGKADIVETKTYNANSTLTSESSSTGVTRQYTYDSRNRLLKTTTSGSDIVTNITQISYGYQANLTVKSGTGSSTESYTYKEVTKDTAGNTISTVYTDVLGRTVKEESGTTFTDYTYDAAGNSVVSYEGNTSNSDCMVYLTLYDEEGRSFAEIANPQISGSSFVIGEDSIVTYTEYDTKGNVVKETDPLGNDITYTYDDEDRLLTTDIAGNGTDITVAYSIPEAGGELVRVTDANGNMKEELLDDAGLTLQITDLEVSGADGKSIVTNYEYDDKGRLVQATYGDKSYVAYTYDGDSERVVQKAEYLASGTLEISTTYSYDVQNRLTAIIHKEGSTEVCEYTYTYDVSGRTLSETVSYDSESGKTTSYAYDAEGRLIKVTYPSGSGLGAMNYTYDAFGNIQNIKKGSSTVREYTYDAFNRVTSIKDYDKPGSSSYILKSYVYDEFGRTTSAVYTEDGDATKVLESYAYTYDKNDNILTETRISNLPAEGSVINETREYVYDAYGRLTKSTKTDHTDGDSEFVTTYEYDAVGNRVKMTEGGMVTTYDYNGLNQLEKADTTDAEIEYTYDERGNQVLESNTTTEETVETTYNVAGEMVQLVKKSGSTTTLTQTNVYNQDGIRISRTQGDTEREYYYNNGVVTYTEDNNNLSSANIQNDDGGVIGTYRGSTYYNYLKNMQGSTESIISETGTTAAVYTYSDFGETEEVVVDTIGNEICYTGAIYDKDTGLYYMNARYYDADTGRFISQDSYRGEIDDAGTWHLYAYCSNNPINYVDPTGHAAINTIFAGVGAIVGWKLGHYVARKLGYSSGAKYWAIRTGVVVGGAVIGWFSAKTMTKILANYLKNNPSIMYKFATKSITKFHSAMKFLGVNPFKYLSDKGKFLPLLKKYNGKGIKMSYAWSKAIFDKAKKFGFKLTFHNPHKGYTWHMHLMKGNKKVDGIHIEMAKKTWKYLSKK